MNSRHFLVWWVVLVCHAGLGAATPPPAASTAGPAAATAVPASKVTKGSVVNPLAPRFKQVRDRIEGLFQYRNQPPPPLDPLQNPFRPPGGTSGAPSSSVATTRGGTDAPPSPDPVPSPVVAAPESVLTLLQQAVATLKVSGVFEKGGRSHLVINARPYQQGDVVQTQVQGETVYLRIKEISKRRVTLVLNDSEMSLTF